MKISKTIRLFILFAVFNPFNTFSQFRDVLNWSTSTEIENGIKISTNIPSDIETMPILLINGYNYKDAAIISLKIAFVQSNGEFRNSTISSNGSFAPRVILANENGHIVLYIDAKGYSGIRFKITSILQGLTNENEWYAGWVITDEFSDAREIIYANEFSGDTRVNGLLTANSAAITDANISQLTVATIQGKTTDFCGTNSTHGIVLDPCDGSIKIESVNDSYSYIAFRGAANLNKEFQGRIGFHDDIGFSFSTVGRPTNSTPNPQSISRMRLDKDGVVSIGSISTITGSNYPYKLYVEGGIRTRKLKVDAPVTVWPDYVFEPSYQLPSLSSVEAFIKSNKHLPDIPSADEVERNGTDVGDLQADLLKKVEELTLYVIEQDKKIKKQQEQINKLNRNTVKN